jgi:hypothetical protein
MNAAAYAERQRQSRALIDQLTDAERNEDDAQVQRIVAALERLGWTCEDTSFGIAVYR